MTETINESILTGPNGRPIPFGAIKVNSEFPDTPDGREQFRQMCISVARNGRAARKKNKALRNIAGPWFAYADTLSDKAFEKYLERRYCTRPGLITKCWNAWYRFWESRCE